tara:strand:- start:17899 stop:20781 length:2883 start_codon:yes stop_codon:yes gene_type:complete
MKVNEKSLAEVARKNLPRDARNLIADATNDITIPYYSGAMQYVDDTLIQRGQGKGLKIYDEIERDTHAFAMLQKRKKTLVAREWEVLPASDADIDVRAADIVRDQLKALPFDRICEELLDATLKGFAISEVVWGRVEGQIAPVDVVTHDQRRFVFDKDWNPRLLTFVNNRDGIELPGRKFIVHRHGVKGNNPYGLGLGTRLFWPVLFKREGVAFWLHFLEKFASPTVLAKTPYGTLSGEQTRLLNSMKNVRSSSALTVPIGTEVEFLEASRSGSVTYQDFLSYWDKQISICVNGETLTTDIGNSGSRAASETHEAMLENLVDSDGDLLSDSLRQQLLTWIVDYNVPGAGIPSVWRTRPENEQETAKTRKSKAEAAEATDKALNTVLRTAARIDADDEAREYITSFGLTDGLSDGTIDRLVAMRGTTALTPPGDPSAAFSDPLKKKLFDHVCFAEPGGAVERITDQLLTHMRRHFERRIAAIRIAALAPTAEEASRNLLALAASWSPDALATQLDLAMEVAALEGREAVFLDGTEETEFAAEVVAQEFLEQIAFLRQKRPKPTKVWTDVLKGNHDRSFVVAGATDIAMVEEFQQAIIDASMTWSEDAFAKDFDRIVEKYGWSYNGGREWRIRTIFQTNLRTSYMAGRLQQMRDPDVVRLRPYWQYRHGDSGTPKNPRPQHVSWDLLILMHDDPWWDIHFPPNDWLCSCGVRTLSLGDLKRLGKSGPDTAPETMMEPIIDRVTGLPSQKPKGIGYGWDYQAGNLWEKGLVPSRLIDDASGASSGGSQVVVIDPPEPLEDLLDKARPFVSKPLPEGLEDEDYVSAFLKPFGATLDEAVLFEDKAGDRIPISAELFVDRSGSFHLGPRDQAILTPLMAEALMDPDEIWLGLVEMPDPVDPQRRDVYVDRRYVRTDAKTGIMVVLQMGLKFWETITAYNPIRGKKPDLEGLDRRRGGKLLWKRKI